MKSINLIFGTHNNQPIGNFDSIIEDVYQRAYKPFLSILNDYPEFKVTLHYSGSLLQWIEENHPEFLMVLGELVKRKQAEILGGGFYEPVLSMIPNTDKIGQVEHMTTFIRQRFGKRPKGFWISERVWEPSHASTLSTTGMGYVFLDDIHVRSAGIDEQEMFHAYTTEDQGKTIGVFPISKPLRYIIPYREPEDVIFYLQSIASEEGDRVVTIIDDGEKYGEWKGSNERCYRQGWIRRFIELIIGNKEWIRTVHPGSYIAEHENREKIYVTCMLYEEMMDWVLAPSKTKKLGELRRRMAMRSGEDGLLPGGMFKGFLRKYPDANLMYSKMMYVHILVNQMGGDRSRKKAAREEMWKGQCNNAYWHGNSGGIYLNHLRKGIYTALIDSEKLTREKSVFLPSIFCLDFDMDGSDEYIYQGSLFNGYVHARGGMLFELDYLPVSWNYLDTLSRYVEYYHSYIEKENGYDWYPRKAFIDHFLAPDADPAGFFKMTYPELGDFVDGLYVQKEIDRERFELALERDGHVRHGDRSVPVRVEKKYRFSQDHFTVVYTITNLSDVHEEFRFATEINLALASDQDPEREISVVSGDKEIRMTRSRFEIDDCKGILVTDLQNEVRIGVTSVNPFLVWSSTVETYSQSVETLERIYQGSTLVLIFPLSLPPGSSWENTLSVRMKNM